jgi:hypothetical protein
MNSVLKLTLTAAIVLASGCSSCSSCSGDKKDVAETPAAPGKKDHTPQPPPAGSDADQRRVAALALASATDAALASFKHDEKPMDPTADGQKRSAEVWFTDTNGGQPLVPKKLIIKELDGSGAAKSQTDMYFDDKSMLAYAHAPDGHFVFRMEGLALWLDPDQNIKHGIKPQDAGARAAALKKDMSSALTMFRIR